MNFNKILDLKKFLYLDFDKFWLLAKISIILYLFFLTFLYSVLPTIFLLVISANARKYFVNFVRVILDIKMNNLAILFKT